MKSNSKEFVLFTLKLFFATAIIVSIIYYNRSELSRAVVGINYRWIIPAILLYVFQMFAVAWRWQLLLRVLKINLTFWEVLSMTMQGIFFSLVLPGAVGGDFAKAAIMTTRTQKGEKLNGIFSIIIDRVVGMMALFTLVGVVGFLSIDFLKHLSGGINIILSAIIAACVMSLSLIAILLFHRNLGESSVLSRLISMIDQYTKGSLQNLMKALDAYRSQYKILLLCFFVSIVFVHFNLAVVVYFIALGTGAENITILLSALGVSIGNTVGALPLFPAGLGARDLLIHNILQLGGIKEQAALIPLVLSSFIVIFSLTGGIFFVFSKKKKRSEVQR